MKDDGPTIKFVAVWGLFALAMLFGQMQLINNGAHMTMSFQVDELNGPVTLASLD